METGIKIHELMMRLLVLILPMRNGNGGIEAEDIALNVKFLSYL